MGCGTSKPGMSGHDAGTTSSSSSGSRHAGSPEEKRRTKAIDRELRAERDRMRYGEGWHVDAVLSELILEWLRGGGEKQDRG